jgi:hypothetical protein
MHTALEAVRTRAGNTMCQVTWSRVSYQNGLPVNLSTYIHGHTIKMILICELLIRLYSGGACDV